MGNTYNFSGKTQFIQEVKDNVSITQNNNSLDNQALNQKLDEMFASLSKIHSQEMENLVNQIFSKIDENHLRSEQFSEEEIKDFNKAKYSTDTKAKIKWTYPLSGVIKELTGFSAELEKEWKRSNEIKPEGIISTLRKIIPHHELQETKFNEIEIESEPKQLEA